MLPTDFLWKSRPLVWRSLMLPGSWSSISVNSLGRCLMSCSLMAALVASGCGQNEKAEEHASVAKPPTVRVVNPELRTIVRVVGQPSFVESYERTSIYPKLTGYIDKWIVDIGDKVKKGDILCKLFVPELVEDLVTKKATVSLDEQKVQLARVIVEVASADAKTAEAGLTEAKAILAKYDAEVDRWNSEVARLTREVERGVIDRQVLLESTNQLKSSLASQDAAKATILKAESELLSKQASLAKAKVDVLVAQADLNVATSEAKRIEAWVGYITLSAPFDGIIVARNANTFDFVQPSNGDPSADIRAPHLSPSGGASPIYVVDRTDIVRIFVDIPEQDANDVRIGSKATVLVKAYRDEPITGNVTRTSWALNVKSRTLRAEIDLPNTATQLLPGMYAYAKVITEHPNVHSLPITALTYTGEKTFCWMFKDGKAVKTEIRTGVSDGQWIEITNLQGPMVSAVEDRWKPVNGSEQVILGDLSILADGGPVELATPAGTGPKVAEATPAPKHASR
jgi:HlyD family secretion protein